MYIIMNYVLCIFLMACLGLEIYLIIKRNRTILVRGRDDYFIAVMVLAAVLLLMPYNYSIDWLEALRNTTAIVVVFGSFGIRRGLSARGIEKLGYHVDWADVKDPRIEQYLTSGLVLRFNGKKHAHRLLFSFSTLKKLLYEFQQHGFDVMVQQEIWNKYEQYSKMSRR